MVLEGEHLIIVSHRGFFWIVIRDVFGLFLCLRLDRHWIVFG